MLTHFGTVFVVPHLPSLLTHFNTFNTLKFSQKEMFHVEQ